MTTPDREQLRQECEARIRAPWNSTESALVWSERCLVLLDALEQAERQLAFAEQQAILCAESHGRLSGKLLTAEARAEQAEQERDEADKNERAAWQAHADEEAQVERFEARLAAVPALVEAAKSARSQAAAPDYDEEAIRDALWRVVQLAESLAYHQASTPPCEHDWVDATNEAVISGEWCRKCNAIRKASTPPRSHE